MRNRGWLIVMLTILVAGPVPAVVFGDESPAGFPPGLTQRLAKTGQLQGTFVQTRYISALSIPLRSSGTFTYQRGEGIVWRTLEPVASVVHISPDQGVVIVDDRNNPQPVPASELVGTIFLGVFSGDFSRLNDYFSVEHEQGVTAREGDHWELRLTPLRKELAENLRSIAIAGTQLVESITLLEPNGDRTEIVFETAETGEKLH